mmetsp:Transcript_64349/g.78683  ORF Transcript_64349/g.78683 Transcript_64349/m.78683 type:complete len:239 (-) Transcript_64349:544-1260(-)
MAVAGREQDNAKCTVWPRRRWVPWAFGPMAPGAASQRRSRWNARSNPRRCSTAAAWPRQRRTRHESPLGPAPMSPAEESSCFPQRSPPPEGSGSSHPGQSSNPRRGSRRPPEEKQQTRHCEAFRTCYSAHPTWKLRYPQCHGSHCCNRPRSGCPNARLGRRPPRSHPRDATPGTTLGFRPFGRPLGAPSTAPRSELPGKIPLVAPVAFPWPIAGRIRSLAPPTNRPGQGRRCRRRASG